MSGSTVEYTVELGSLDRKILKIGNQGGSGSKVNLYFVFIILIINLLVALFPVVPKNQGGYFFQKFHHDLYVVLTDTISPILMTIFDILFLLGFLKNKSLTIENKRIFLASGLTFLVLLLSLYTHNFSRGKGVALLFIVSNFFIFSAAYPYAKFSKLINLIRLILTLWLILPLGLLIIFPSMSTFFISRSPEYSFQGFADSHIGFGLWLGLLVILLLREPNGPWRLWALLISMIELILCQSRAALIALAICYLYAYWVAHRNSLWSVIKRLFIVLISCRLILVIWQIFLNRNNALSFLGINHYTLLNSPRLQLLILFFKFIKHNWLFGYGSTYKVYLWAGWNEAHNLLIQSIADYGIFVSFQFFAYLIIIFLEIPNKTSRMIFIFFILYSLAEPTFMPVYFFSPLPIIFFMIISMLKNDEATSRMSDSRLKAGIPHSEDVQLL